MMIVYDLSIDNATWTTPQYCSPGSVALSNAIEARWPILLNRQGAYGCYNRRPTAGGGKSIHGDGRAIDIGIGWTPTPEQKAALQECVDHLAANAKHLGVQRIIYNRRIWDRNGWRSYNDNAHQDHAHVEQTYEAAWSNPLPAAQAKAVISPPGPGVEVSPNLAGNFRSSLGGHVFLVRNDIGWVYELRNGKYFGIAGPVYFDSLVPCFGAPGNPMELPHTATSVINAYAG